ncbi:hypothetical protein BDV37DRAFT_266401 [Aspergillus pseudonomiae]|uniref:Uncharacterized protein n=1 Tax=Aspergillus pseudonomiae TaxID=1506151 RepID=A0A5N7CSM0_9EURO|nr:uncharacterized protein BDV37DRAFT_266401 [Aspergillus pseudonomiae]KAE8397144.1 hypothetical protein BDV37DRAFT_266401 [Aspergillus pseudonomiae]
MALATPRARQPLLYWPNRAMECANNFPGLLETCGMIYQLQTSKYCDLRFQYPDNHNRMPFFTAA